MDIERTIDDIEQLEENVRGTGYQTAECKRHLGCESKARRQARA
jgi:hypothetical protein